MNAGATHTDMIESPKAQSPSRWAFPALIFGNIALAVGPFLVRHAGTGPVAAGFWRMAIAFPLLVLLARMLGQTVWPKARATRIIIIIGAILFAFDIAAWHGGIHLTKLGNATLFGNIGSFAFAIFGLWMARKWPSSLQALALSGAAMGAALLMASSAELSADYLRGDMLAALAGLFYAGYLIAVDRARGSVPSVGLLAMATGVAALTLLPMSLMLGEQMIPESWGPLLTLAISSQLVGQGLLVYALGQVPPLIVGLALLTQPAIAATLGWLYYDERMGALDWVGALLIGGALVLVRLKPVRRTGR